MKTMKHKIYLSFIMPMLLLGCSRISDHKSISVSNPEITTDDILEHIKFLSDDDREGRYPGSKGSQKTVEYLVDYFKNNNIEPIGSNGYLQPLFRPVSEPHSGSTSTPPIILLSV